MTHFPTNIFNPNIPRVDLYGIIELQREWNVNKYGEPIVDNDFENRMKALKDYKVHMQLEVDKLSRELVRCILEYGKPGVKIEGLGKKKYSSESVKFRIEEEQIDYKLRKLRNMGLIDIVFESHGLTGEWLFEGEFFYSKNPDRNGKSIFIKESEMLRSELTKMLKPFESEKKTYFMGY